jgi:hypothetical protein
MTRWSMTIPVLPPVEFDHPYKGKLIIKTVRSVAEMGAVCPTATKIACASISHGPITPKTTCLIYLRDDAEMRRQNWRRHLILRHEIGHCNGWVGHAGARRALMRNY